MRLIWIISSLKVLCAASIATAQTFAYPDCYCTDSRGARVDLGDQACLTINGRSFMAVCDMSLNNPIWRYSETPCPMS